MEVHPLVIEQNVLIQALSVIEPTVREIGKGAKIAQQTCVHQRVPEGATVRGSPAEIVEDLATPHFGSQTGLLPSFNMIEVTIYSSWLCLLLIVYG